MSEENDPITQEIKTPPSVEEMNLWRPRCALATGTWMDLALWRCCTALLSFKPFAKQTLEDNASLTTALAQAKLEIAELTKENQELKAKHVETTRFIT